MTEEQNVSPLDAVFEAGQTRPAQPSWVRVLPWGVALLAHGLLLSMAMRTEPSLETWSAKMAATLHDELALDAPVTIETEEAPLPAPEPEPESEPAPALKIAPRPRTRAPEPEAVPPAGEASAPAEASAILVADVDSDGPVDLTDSAFISGSATTNTAATVSGSALGTGTGTSGTGNSAGGQGTGETGAGAGTSATGPSRARPVRLDGRQWACDWPATAIAQDIFEQHVVLRAQVRADGSVEAVTVLDDPGHGFGPKAAACARATRFSPSLDAAGRPQRALSPPIRVRFTR